MPQLILIRGIPGSGKTTMAKNKYPSYVLCEADQYFETKNGYKYDPKKITIAHDYCFKKAVSALKEGKDVVVCNTFTRVSEMQRYLDLPYPVRVITAKGQFRNVHGVPGHVVKKMKERFEEYNQ